MVRSAALLRPVFDAHALQLRSLEGLVTRISRDRKWYNAMLLTSEFWASFTAPLLLLFEADVALCPRPTWPVESFSRFAFVGAPPPLESP